MEAKLWGYTIRQRLEEGAKTLIHSFFALGVLLWLATLTGVISILSSTTIIMLGFLFIFTSIFHFLFWPQFIESLRPKKPKNWDGSDTI